MKKDAYGGAGRRRLKSEGRWGRKERELEVEKWRDMGKMERRKMEGRGGEKRKQSPLDGLCNPT